MNLFALLAFGYSAVVTDRKLFIESPGKLTEYRLPFFDQSKELISDCLMATVSRDGSTSAAVHNTTDVVSMLAIYSLEHDFALGYIPVLEPRALALSPKGDCVAYSDGATVFVHCVPMGISSVPWTQQVETCRGGIRLVRHDMFLVFCRPFVVKCTPEKCVQLFHVPTMVGGDAIMTRDNELLYAVSSETDVTVVLPTETVTLDGSVYFFVQIDINVIFLANDTHGLAWSYNQVVEFALPSGGWGYGSRVSANGVWAVLSILLVISLYFLGVLFMIPSFSKSKFSAGKAGVPHSRVFAPVTSV